MRIEKRKSFCGSVPFESSHLLRQETRTTLGQVDASFFNGVSKMLEKRALFVQSKWHSNFVALATQSFKSETILHDCFEKKKREARRESLQNKIGSFSLVHMALVLCSVCSLVDESCSTSYASLDWPSLASLLMSHVEASNKSVMLETKPEVEDPKQHGATSNEKAQVKRGARQLESVVFDDELSMDDDDDDDDEQEAFFELENPLDYRSTEEIKVDFGQSAKENGVKNCSRACWSDDERVGSPSVRQTGASACAVHLSRGGQCIRYADVEAAASAARRSLDFRLPADLSSLEPSEASVHAVGELLEQTTRLLAQRHALSAPEVAFELTQVEVSRTSLWRACPRVFRAPEVVCDPASRYRTLTGACNSLLGAQLGARLMPFVRLLPAEYADGVGVARRARNSLAELPSARLVSLHLHADHADYADYANYANYADHANYEHQASSELSALFAFWGQLVNHDVASASSARDETGHGRACCGSRRQARVCMPMALEPDDPLYGPLGVTCHEFKRSLAGVRPGCSLGPRTQVNLVSGYLDASFVYGSRRSLGGALRGSRGQLAMQRQAFRSRPPREPINLKPLLAAQRSQPDAECASRPRNNYCFLSGDARTNQQPPLAALHTVYARQHNRLATALGALNAHWSDERVYQEARHVQAALVQHALLGEYLPALLGPHLCELLNLTETPAGQHWDHYQPEAAMAGVSQAFAGAAFRAGHSSVPSLVFRFDASHEPRAAYPLHRLFNRPWLLYEPLAVDEFLLGLVDSPAARADPIVSSQLAGQLLAEPNTGAGLDLVAVNIQRGRDQGLASYLDYRHWCQLGRVQSFEQLVGVMSNASARAMANLYDSVEDIDLFAGGLAEYPLDQAQLGPTFACIVGKQFAQLRFGDRFWFESSLGPHAFSAAQLASIKQVSLARILCANGDHLATIQMDALRLAHPILNPRVACDSLADLDISLWLDARAPTNGRLQAAARNRK